MEVDMTDEEFKVLVEQANEALKYMGKCTCASKVLKYEGARAFAELCDFCKTKKEENKNE
jgi:hypothetical protein